jgi:hypothetical protein
MQSVKTFASTRVREADMQVVEVEAGWRACA